MMARPMHDGHTRGDRAAHRRARSPACGSRRQPASSDGAATARGESPALHRERRGARLTRREEGAYWAYVTDEQRSQAGCIAARMQRGLSPRAVSPRAATPARDPPVGWPATAGRVAQADTGPPIRRCCRGIRTDEMAAPAEPREPLDEALQPGGGMTHGRGDLERQGVFGMVVDEIDLVAALTPMVEAHLVCRASACR